MSRKTKFKAIASGALAITASLAAISASAQPARPAPSGPAARAILKWFTTDRSLGCFDRDLNDSACAVGVNLEGFEVYYGDATGGGPQADALAFAYYMTDPTGNNAQASVVAWFHRDGAGYRFVKTFPRVGSPFGLVKGTTVRFSPGKAAFSLVVLRPNDPLCCPTGRARIAVTLNAAPSRRGID